MASNCKALWAVVLEYTGTIAIIAMLGSTDSTYKTVWAEPVRVCRQYLLESIDITCNTVWPVVVRLYEQYLLSCMGATYKNVWAVPTIFFEQHF